VRASRAASTPSARKSSSQAAVKTTSPHYRRSSPASRLVKYVPRTPSKPISPHTQLTNTPLQLDVTDFATLPSKISEITKCFPTIDAVFLNAGIMSSFSFADPSSSTPTAIATEIATNLTAPILLTRLLLPHLLALQKPASLLFTSSGLGFVPVGFYPVYCPTKAGIHSFCVALRQQLNPVPGNQVSVIEIVPPYVDTALDAGFLDHVNEIMGDHKVVPMPLEEYLDITMETLEGKEAKDLKEVAPPGSADMRVRAWRGGFGKVLEAMGIDA
jgi:short-subunit dehydrogenase involved in D-alanine esterification of teichoic acids